MFPEHPGRARVRPPSHRFSRLARSTRPLALALSLACAASVLAVTTASAQPGAPYAQAPGTTRGDVIERARVRADSFLSARRLPGMAVSVAVHGEIIWSEGFGYADIEHRTPITPLTRFRAASVSKPMTAAAVGLLHEQGRLDLDAPVQRYVPSFPVKRWPITTRQLAGHLAGVRHYRGNEMMSRTPYPTVLASLEMFSDDSLEHEPATRYLYSSYGWNLISAVVEGAAGQPFLAFMRERVFTPLGMHATVGDHVDSIIPYRASFYVRGADGRLVNAPYVDNSNKWAGGGFLTTADDMARFGSAHLRAGFLREETLRLLFTTQRTRGGEATGYGIGWTVGTDAEGRRIVSHSGGAMGGSAFLLVYPDQGVVVAILANVSGAGTNARVAAGFAEPFMR